MTIANVIELLDRLKANAEEAGRYRDAVEIQVSLDFLAKLNRDLDKLSAT